MRCPAYVLCVVLLAPATGCSLVFSSGRVVGESIDATAEVDAAPQPDGADARVEDAAADAGEDAFAAEAPDAFVDPTRVTGTVSFQTYGQPAAGAIVRVGSLFATVEDGGTFELRDVSAGLFDLRVEAVALGGRPTVSVYQGVRARRLDVALQHYSNATSHTVRIQGRVTPIGGTLEAGRELQVLTSTDIGGTRYVVADPSTGAFSIDHVFRSSGLDAIAPLWAVEVTPGPPLVLHGFASAELSVRSAVDESDVSLVVRDVSSREVPLAGADSLRGLLGFSLFRPRNSLGFNVFSTTAITEVRAPLPTLPSGSGAGLRAFARRGLDPAYWVLDETFDGTTPLEGFPSVAPTDVTPPTGATWGAGAAIRWTGTSASVCCVEIRDGDAAGLQYLVCGTDSSVEVPPEVLASGGAYTWRVRAFPGLTMDEVAQATSFSRYSQIEWRDATVM